MSWTVGCRPDPVRHYGATMTKRRVDGWENLGDGIFRCANCRRPWDVTGSPCSYCYPDDALIAGIVDYYNAKTAQEIVRFLRNCGSDATS